MKKHLGITIDESRTSLLPLQGKIMLEMFYCQDGETIQECFGRSATAFCMGDLDHAQRIYDGDSQRWGVGSTPTISNAPQMDWTGYESFKKAYGVPEEIRHNFNVLDLPIAWMKKQLGDKLRGLPISCFLSYIADSREGLLQASNETKALSMSGGGVSIMAGLREPGDRSTGAMPHMKTYDADVAAYRQSKDRRGSYAMYMDVSHPEIKQFLHMREPSGEADKMCLNLNTGINFTDDFMEAVCNGDTWDLISPADGRIVETIDAREFWDEFWDVKYQTGFPYVHYIDTSNRSLPLVQKAIGLKVRQSNLCTEITLATDEYRTAVCCLGHINLEFWDVIKDTNYIADKIRFLDNVIEVFIHFADKKHLGRAIYSATMERALGLGVVGWHSYLQQNNIAIESGGINSAAQQANIVFKEIKKQAVAASRVLAFERGEPDDMVGTNQRNSHLLAIAPNASSSNLIGSSPGIEAWKNNYFVNDGRSGTHVIKNKQLDNVIKDKLMEKLRLPNGLLPKYIDRDKLLDEEDAIWKLIKGDKGSIENMEFFTDHEKAVFRSAKDIDQRYVIEQAGIRQKHICQAQSLNLFMKAGATAQQAAELGMLAWAKGVKSIYYLRGESRKSADVTGKVELNQLIRVDDNECISCDS